ncbi:MAG: hypothetical protein RR574_18700, partial [Comamonas sp.]
QVLCLAQALFCQIVGRMGQLGAGCRPGEKAVIAAGVANAAWPWRACGSGKGVKARPAQELMGIDP